MLVSRKALGKLVPLDDVNSSQLSELFNNYGGLEVESVHPLVPQNDYVIGHITSIEKHSDADMLNVCQVDIGSKILTIVCGAPNVAAGQYVIVAPVGTTMPNGLHIEAREVRGVVSNGMICSLGEIGIDHKYLSETDLSGIYVFTPNDRVVIGGAALAALDFDTEIFDLSITPNRADCLNYRGLAHEVAALTQQRLEQDTFAYQLPSGTFSINEYVESLDVPSDHVQSYNLIAYKNVKIKAAPQWMQSFLIAHDIRPINNVVDITNYVMLQLGLPLHAFDADKLPTKTFVVRAARADETLTTLDDKVRTLSPEDVVISTGDDAIALAGVMGGANTEIDAQTTNVVLEAAIFDPVSVRKTAITFDLRSEASLRMEKLLDPSLPRLALALVSELLLEYAEAEVSNDVLSFQTEQASNTTTISANYDDIVRRIGTEVPLADIYAIFTNLAFDYTVKGETIEITPPSWRPDIRIFEDIVEEIARLYGLDRIPNALPVDVARPVFRTSKDMFTDHAHTTLQALGLQETITYTLESKQTAVLGAYETTMEPIDILYPLNTERETLRTTTYASMIDTLAYHHNHAFTSAAFYEITDVYGRENDTFSSYPVLSFGGYGTIEAQQLYDINTPIDFYLLKTWLERLLPTRVIHQLDYRKTENALFHPGVAADVFYDNQYVGTLGKIHPQRAKDLDVQTDLYIGELRLNTLYTIVQSVQMTYEPVSKFPSMSRDITFLTPRTLPVGELITSAWAAAGPYAKDIQVLDVYTGEHVEATQKAVTINLIFNSERGTLTNEDVSACVDAVVNALETTHAVTLRK